MTEDTNALASKTINPVSQFLKTELGNLDWPRETGVIEATFVRKENRTAFFNLGHFGTGIVFGIEFQNARDIIRSMSPGDTVPAKVVSLDGESGYIELSLTEAGKHRLWQQTQELMETGEIATIKVTGVNPGGIVGSLGELRAFLPFSQLSPEHAPATEGGPTEEKQDSLKKLIGTELSVKVISVNPKKNRLIVSERETVSVNLKELLSNYTVGQIIDGVVSGIADFGIFVKFADNPQIEGLVHISEIAHRLIDNPKEMAEMGQSLKVKIVDIKDGKVFLSMKALLPDPWSTIGETYKSNQDVRGKVHKFNPFGAVVELPDGMQAMIHVSAFGGSEEMKKVLLPGESYPFVIESVKPDEKRILLKLKS